jgi:hypothetical protein
VILLAAMMAVALQRGGPLPMVWEIMAVDVLPHVFEAERAEW